jgi:hypothetical protein
VAAQAQVGTSARRPLKGYNRLKSKMARQTIHLSKRKIYPSKRDHLTMITSSRHEGSGAP